MTTGRKGRVMEINRRLAVLPSETELPKGEIIKPEGLKLKTELIGGFKRTWEEYIPSGYNGEKEVPLVISLHGGSKYTLSYRSSWVKVGEREGFIVVFGHSLEEGKIRWNAWREFSREDGFPDDVEYLDEIISRVLNDYNIDRSRIYIHGQSVGDKMASTYVFERSSLFAAAACLSGPMGASCFVNWAGEIIYGPRERIPVIRRHGTEDLDIPLQFNRIDIKREPGSEITEKHRRDKMTGHQVINNLLWRRCCGCEELPYLIARGKFNAAVYPGNPYDFCYYAENGAGHSPGQDMADDIWSYFFTGFQRAGAQIIRRTPDKCLEPDRGCAAAALGSKMAYINHERTALDEAGHAALRKEDVICAPASFFEKALGARVEQEQGMVQICLGGHVLQAAKGNRAVVFDSSYGEIGLCFEEGGTLYLPISDVARKFGYRPLEKYDVVYITPNESVMSYDLAYIIKEILGTEKVMSPSDCLAIEDHLVNEWTASGGIVYDRESLPKN